MNTGHFVTRDEEGNCYRVIFDRDSRTGDTTEAGHAPPRYALEDGSPVQRIDNETFKVLGTGAYVSLVRE